MNDYVCEGAEGKGAKATPKKGAKSGEKYITAIKNTFGKSQITPVSDLIEALEKQNQGYGNKFVVKGYVAGFVSTEPKDIIKQIQTDDKKIYSFGENVKHKTKVRRIYHLIMHVMDDSVEGTDKFLNVYVLTGEFDSHLFDNWGILPPYDQAEQWNNLKEAKLAEFEKKLKAVKNQMNKVKLVVELMMTKSGKPFYRLVDTVFLNF